MNLKEEYRYQKKVKLWDALELSEKNRELAEQYMDISQPENEELLKKVEHQSFKKDWDYNERGYCWNYLRECRNKLLMEEVKRYVRFVATVGGSTSAYLLSKYRYYDGLSREELLEYLTREQVVAIEAESFAWDSYQLKQVTTKVKETNPEVLREVMSLCYHNYINTKTLLAGLSLFYTKPIEEKEELSKENQKKQEQIQEMVDFLIEGFVATIPNFLKTGRFSEEDKKLLKEFIEEPEGNKKIRISNLLTVLHGHGYDKYLITLLAGTAFLAIEHSKKFLNCLKLTMLMDMENQCNTTLDICLTIHTREWFYKHIGILEEFSMDKKQYLIWCVKNKIEDSIKRIVINYPETVKEVKDNLDAEQMLYLLNFVKAENVTLYEEIKDSIKREYERKIAQEIAQSLRVNREIAVQYLLGEVEIEALYPFVKKWKEYEYISSSDTWRKSISLKQLGNEQMYERIAVLMALLAKASFFVSDWMEEDKRELTDIMQTLSKQKVDKKYQLELLASMYEFYCNYRKTTKEIFLNSCTQILCNNKSEWEDEIVTTTKEGTVLARQFCMQILNVYSQEYKETLLGCVGDTSKQIKSFLVMMYGSHKEWESEIKDWLNSKKSQEREMAVLVLKNWGVDSYKAELLQAMEKEKSKKLKELMQSCLGIQTEAEQNVETKEELVKEILKGGRKRVVLWAYETPVPTVHKLDGSEVSEDYMKAILVAYAGMQPLGVSADAIKLAKELEPKELAEYMNHLFETWLKLGAEAKKKWVLYAISIHGGETIIPVLYAQIQKWAESARGAMAAEAVKALALNGGATALLLVDQIAKKFKHRQIKAAAVEALDYAAKQLGITKAELEDRIVPNLGFNEQMERVFDYGTRKFTVALTPTLELLVTDESGKKLKSLPAPRKRDEEEKAKAANAEYKLLKKQLKTVVTNQKMRLEQALSTERLWKATQWKELFVKNPVMHQFAIGLIWGRYEEGQLKETFRYMEDGSFNTVDEDEYKFPEEGWIGLVHPVELSEEELVAWKEQLSDYEITQPIEQLERIVYRLTEEERLQTELTRFGGKVLNGLSLSGKLLGFGWYRGEIGDGGSYFTFYREDGAMGVELEFSGAGVGYEGEDEDVTVYGVQFYKAGNVARDLYDRIKTESLYRLCEVNPRYFSEIVLQLTKVTASSVEQLQYPECKKLY